MIFFLKSRNQIQPLTEGEPDVPLFSGGNDEVKYKIPRNSSVLSLTLSIFAAICFIPLYIGFKGIYMTWGIYLLIFSVSLIYMPLVLIFTIKKKKNPIELTMSGQNNISLNPLNFHEVPSKARSESH